MIEQNRPICIMEYDPPRDLLARHNDQFKDFGRWTLCEKPYSDIQWDWTACRARFGKEVGGKRYYVKCMEAADWYVSLKNGGIMDGDTGYYCDFHKPRVREDI